VADLAEGAASAAIWAGIRDLEPLVGHQGDLWRIACLPSGAANIAAEIGAEAALFDHAGAVIWALLPKDADPRAAIAGRGEAIKVRGANAAPFAPKPAAIAQLSHAIKAQFDPDGRFAQGAI